jgi:hypothetical protein
MDIKALPRKWLDLNLQVARVPLQVAEKVTGNTNGEAATWGPAIAYESAEASVKQTVGTLLRDQTLLDDARLQRAKVSELKEAAARKMLAEQERAEADAELREKREQAEQQRRQAAEQAQRRKQELEREKAAATRKVQEEAARKKSAARQAAAKKEQQVEQQETAARLKAAEAEAKALAKEEQAVRAAGQATDLEAQAQVTKAARRR